MLTLVSIQRGVSTCDGGREPAHLFGVVGPPLKLPLHLELELVVGHWILVDVAGGGVLALHTSPSGGTGRVHAVVEPLHA